MLYSYKLISDYELEGIVAGLLKICFMQILEKDVKMRQFEVRAEKKYIDTFIAISPSFDGAPKEL